MYPQYVSSAGGKEEECLEIECSGSFGRWSSLSLLFLFVSCFSYWQMIWYWSGAHSIVAPEYFPRRFSSFWLSQPASQQQSEALRHLNPSNVALSTIDALSLEFAIRHIEIFSPLFWRTAFAAFPLYNCGTFLFYWIGSYLKSFEGSSTYGSSPPLEAARLRSGGGGCCCLAAKAMTTGWFTIPRRLRNFSQVLFSTSLRGMIANCVIE